MELLANIVAGTCDTPYLSREQALADLAHLVKSLRQDQHDPRLSAESLLGNFLDLATGKRLGPLAVGRREAQVPRRVRPGEGRGHLEGPPGQGLDRPAQRRPRGRHPAIRRRTAGTISTAPWPPSRDDATKQKIMDILDQRVVMIVFIDNANLSASAAKTIGALLQPAIKDQPGVAELRQELEQFLDDQREGYERLYDPKAGQFYFGRDATKDRLFRLGRPAGEMGDGPRRLPGQRVPRPGHVRRHPVRAAHRRDQEPRLQDEAVPDAATGATSTCWPPGRARHSRPWASSCR